MPGRKVQADLVEGPGASDHTIDQAAVNLRQRVPATSAADTSYPSERLARIILLTVLSGFAGVEIINVLQGPGPSQRWSHGLMITLGIASICVLFILQVLNASPAAQGWPVQRRVGVLVAQALVTFFPLLILGSEWGGMAGWLAGSILLLLSGWIAWVLFAVVILSILAWSLVLGIDASGVAYLTVASLDTGLMVFGLSRLSLIICYLKTARTELAELAIIRERMRFARDLHDLLGYSLSAITLKAELTRRLVGSNPERARDELAELLDVSRRALADVRLVARGYRNMSLSKEAATAVSLLSTAGIRSQMDIDCGPLDEQVDTALATVLREAVTNMLRHSTAQNCTIEAAAGGGAITLRVTNDGIRPTPAPRRDGGGGLQNLAARLEAVGGTLSATRHDGRFEVLATVAIPARTDSG